MHPKTPTTLPAVWLLVLLVVTSCTAGASSTTISASLNPAVPTSRATTAPTPPQVASPTVAPTPTVIPSPTPVQAVEEPEPTPEVEVPLPIVYDNRIVIVSPSGWEARDTIVESAVLSPVVSTPWWMAAEDRNNPDNLRVTFYLSIDVDERSGEDGAPKPRLDLMSTSARSIGELAGMDFADVGELNEGWFGNDAPELENITGHFGQWVSPSEIEVAFTATFGGPQYTMHFAGVVPVSPLRVMVSSTDDASGRIEQIFGPDAMSQFVERPSTVEDTTPAPGRIFAMDFDWLVDGVVSETIVEPDTFTVVETVIEPAE